MIIKLSYTLLIFCCLKVNANLFPTETSSKEVKDIRWKFAVENSLSRNKSFKNKWWKKILLMHDYVDWAWLVHLTFILTVIQHVVDLYFKKYF